ncbi:ParD-like family protein [Ruegeria marisrubri]|uniref:ParD-like family protein n=1 Tax=Ruegeria marisrubri TaxID=1685379 RepID=UPI001CD2BCF7|nr:ParD-like family protein [Ruegeria marisrubri]MCA0907714.1 ParD-like family protein [Ruegeria marisrubri]
MVTPPDHERLATEIVELADDELMDYVRQEAGLRNRSVDEQMRHWLLLGRAVEQSEKFDFERVIAALQAELLPVKLTPLEYACWLSLFSDLMGEPSAAEKAFFEQRKQSETGQCHSEPEVNHPKGSSSK